MPRIALAWLGLVGACSFDADYSGGTLLCSDHKCPSGLECRTDLPQPECRPLRQDAGADMEPDDVMPDGIAHARTCNDPEIIPMTGGTVTGTTANRPLGNTIAVSCGGSTMFGYDAVYRVDNVSPGKQLTLSLGASWTGAAVYVIQPCGASGTCIGNTYAQPNVPVNITTIANGPPYVVVDSTLAGTSGEYTLNVSVN